MKGGIFLLLNKIKEVKKEINAVSYTIKYLDKFGFASVYYKFKGGARYPVIAIPDAEEDSEDYIKFSGVLKECGIEDLDEQSLVALLKYVEYVRFMFSGKKYPHQDTADFRYIDFLKKVIAEDFPSGVPVKNIRCIYNDNTKLFNVMDTGDIEYFDEARKVLGI